jgi:hypothetical protein
VAGCELPAGGKNIQPARLPHKARKRLPHQRLKRRHAFDRGGDRGGQQTVSAGTAQHVVVADVRVGQQVMVVGTLAIGQTLIILTAGIDLSNFLSDTKSGISRQVATTVSLLATASSTSRACSTRTTRARSAASE